MADELSIRLTADVASFRQNLTAAAAELNRTGETAQTASNNITSGLQRVNAINLSGFTRSLQAGEVSVRSLSEATQAASTTASRSLATIAAASAASGRAVTNGSNSAAFALTNLGRVAQDAPFGFIGIQNNLNPLLESFQRLRVETGSNSAAIRALAGSFAGPAGLGVALSLISSAITFYTMYQQKANKVTNDAKKTTDEYVNSLDQLSQVQVKGAQNAQKELTELTSLYKVSTNTTISLKQRKDAVDELQSKYPEYFKNIKDETILNGGAKTAYDNLTASIIATARARAAQDLITKNSSKKLENEQKVTDLQTESDKLALKAIKLRKGAEGDIGGVRDLSLNKAIGAEGERIRILQQQNEIKKESEDLDTKNLKLTESITEQVKKGADLAGKVGKERKVKKVNPVIGNLGVPDDFGILGIVPSEITAKPILKIVPVLDLTGVDQAYIDLSKAIDDIGAKINSMSSITGIVNSMGEALSSGFSAVGEAIASGGNIIESFGSAFLSSFASFLSELGALVIKKGALLIAIGVAENIVLPGSGSASIASGATLLAAGAALSIVGGIGGSIAKGGNKGQSSGSQKEAPRPIPQFATGVQNFKGGLAMVGERGPEIVDLPTGSSVIPNGRSERMMRSGNNDVVLNGNFGISMETLYFSLKRTEKKLGRLG